MTERRTRITLRPGLRERSGDLLSKQGLAFAALCEALLQLAPGERMPRIQALAEQHSLGVGTVQAALDAIQERGLAELEARGRLGTFVRRISYAELWMVALHRATIGALPLPYSLRFEGIATGLREQLGQPPLDVELRFVRGSAQRLQMIATHECDWAVVSRFAAETADAYGFRVEAALLLGPGSYMGEHAIIARAQSGDPFRAGARVGIDLHSTDHTVLTRSLVRGHSVELVEIEYSLGLRLLRAGAIDATVWSIEDLPAETDDLQIMALSEHDHPELARLREAAIVVGQRDRASAHLLGGLLAPQLLRQTQEEVVARRRLPSY